MRAKPPFRADHVGSLLRPADLIAARVASAEGKMFVQDLRAIEDRSVREVVAMQENVGLQVATDGEMRRDSWRDAFFESVDGFSNERGPSTFTFQMAPGREFRSRPVPTVVSKLKRRKSMAADDYSFLAATTKLTGKAMLPSPSVNHFFRGDEMITKSAYDDRHAYFSDIARIYREEIADLGAAGCRYLQIDDVPSAILCDPAKQAMVRARGENPDQLFDDYIDLFNESVRDHHPDMTVSVHLCRGNAGKGIASGGYEPIAEKLFNRLDVDGFFLEFDDERSGGFEPLRYVPKGRVVVLGLVSSKNPALEPADGLKRRIEEASRFVDLDALCLSPQCGFSSVYNTFTLTPDDQRRKLEHVVSVARQVWG